MEKSGYIKLSRSLQQSWLWNSKEPFSRAQAWIDLLFLANYKDVEIPYRGGMIVCKRGTVNLSYLSLAQRWHWDRKRVQRFLRLLNDSGTVTTKATTHRTVITIVNYDLYQDGGTTSAATDATTNDSANVQQVTNKRDITKECKEVITEKNKDNLFFSKNKRPKRKTGIDWSEV